MRRWIPLSAPLTSDHSLAGSAISIPTDWETKATDTSPYRIREQLITSGVRLADSRDESDVIIEAGLSAYGTDSQTDKTGILGTNALPDVYLFIRNHQYAVAGLSMFAWEKESGAAVWQTGPIRAHNFQENRKVLGTRPFYSGIIEHPAEQFSGSGCLTVH